MKDVEILLRGLTLLIEGHDYAPPMLRFLNQFSRSSRSKSDKKNDYLFALLESFFKACADLPSDAFLNKKNRRFNVALYEAAFSAVYASHFQNEGIVNKPISSERLRILENDEQFVSAANVSTTQTRNVKLRLERASTLLGA